MTNAQKEPQVSIILPAYNAAQYIGEAVGSILAQTFQDFELLVIDDGSADETYRIVEAFQDSRIRLLRNPTNLGLVVSLNRGVEASGAALVARMDADDISLPQRLEVELELLESDPRLGLVSCAYEDFDTKHGSLGTKSMPISDADIRWDLYCKTHCFCHAAALMRRRTLEDVGGYRQQWFPIEDRDLFLRMLELWKGANTPEMLYQVRRHESSIVATNAQRQSDLMVTSTIEALPRGRAPADVAPSTVHQSLARGELFAAFGLAMQDDLDVVTCHIDRALALDEQTVRVSFAELLNDRLVTYMHTHDADAQGGKQLLQRVFSALPVTLANMRSRESAMQAQLYAIAAFQYDKRGQRGLAQRKAIRSLLACREQWHNHGLIKLALSKGLSRERSIR